MLDWIARIRPGGDLWECTLAFPFLFMVTLFLELVQAVMLMLTMPCHGVNTPGLDVYLDERELRLPGDLIASSFKVTF